MTPASHQIEIDVRTIPPRERHERIFALFDSLECGNGLAITSDHEPRPLRAQFERLRTGQYVWFQRMVTSDLWKFTIRRIIGQSQNEDIAHFLQRCALLADVYTSSRDRLQAAAAEHTLSRGQSIAEQGAEWNGFGIVREGTLSAIIASPYGREHALYDVLPTEPFGEVSLLDGGITLARFEVTSAHAQVLVFPKTVLAQVMDADISFIRRLGAISAQRTRVLVERFATQTSMPTIARVAGVLLLHAGPEPGMQPALATLHGTTQSQIAATAGTVKEVVSRVLMELEQARAIERKQGRIVKVDRERLRFFSSHQ